MKGKIKFISKLIAVQFEFISMNNRDLSALDASINELAGMYIHPKQQ